MAYAIANQGDWTMATLFFSNAFGCGAIIGIAAYNARAIAGAAWRH